MKQLSYQVIFIFGFLGALRCIELTNLKLECVEKHGDIFLVKIPSTKNYTGKSFTISKPYFDIVDKYLKLRPEHCDHNRFFVNFQRGKCTTQAIGKNKFAKTPKTAAAFLGVELDDSEPEAVAEKENTTEKKRKKGYTGNKSIQKKKKKNIKKNYVENFKIII